MIPRSNLESFLLLVYQVHKQEERISEATNDEGDEESFFSLGKVDELDQTCILAPHHTTPARCRS